MKILFVLFLVLALPVFTAAESVGRFQLQVHEIELAPYAGMTEPVKLRILFKLDTVTGQVWQFSGSETVRRVEPDKGTKKMINGWVLVSEDFETAVLRFQYREDYYDYLKEIFK